MRFAFIEQGPRMFDGRPSSNGVPPIDRSAPVAGSSARTEPFATTPPTGDHAWAGDSVQVPPTLVALLAMNRREPSHTPPARAAKMPSGVAVPIFACHTGAPLSWR